MSNAASRQELYLKEYPLLLSQLKHLVALARARDSNVAFIALFGSVARMEPGRYSDADVLILVHDQAQFYAAQPTPGVALLWMAYQKEAVNCGDDERLGNWPVTAVVSDIMASDLDYDFLNNVARDGVELYRQLGYTPPPMLAHLTSWDRWRRLITRNLAISGVR
ncbi:MAG TPA: nucleotidyltransferase domain-containing protein [Ktedonobacterales bacterium]|nr:nucleotidyltransferase domain-containing protein [Ktedonobacterales bacterium]